MGSVKATTVRRKRLGHLWAALADHLGQGRLGAPLSSFGRVVLSALEVLRSTLSRPLESALVVVGLGTEALGAAFKAFQSSLPPSLKTGPTKSPP